MFLKLLYISRIGLKFIVIHITSCTESRIRYDVNEVSEYLYIYERPLKKILWFLLFLFSKWLKVFSSVLLIKTVFLYKLYIIYLSISYNHLSVLNIHSALKMERTILFTVLFVYMATGKSLYTFFCHFYWIIKAIMKCFS